MEGILHALPDPLRAAIYGDMAGAGCAQTCSTFQQVIDRSIPKSTLSQHFPTLRKAGLIRSERQGVEMLDTTRCDEINRRFPGLLPSIMVSCRAQTGGSAAGKRKAMKKRPAQA